MRETSNEFLFVPSFAMFLIGVFANYHKIVCICALLKEHLIIGEPQPQQRDGHMLRLTYAGCRVGRDLN